MTPEHQKKALHYARLYLGAEIDELYDLMELEDDTVTARDKTVIHNRLRRLERDYIELLQYVTAH